MLTGYPFGEEGSMVSSKRMASRCAWQENDLPGWSVGIPGVKKGGWGWLRRCYRNPLVEKDEAMQCGSRRHMECFCSRMSGFQIKSGMTDALIKRFFWSLSQQCAVVASPEKLRLSQ